MSTQLSLLDHDSDTAPQGLECHPEFVSPAEEAELLGRIDGADWLTDIARRVAHFGCKYDYSNRRLDDSARIGPLPEWLLSLARRARTAATPGIADLLDAEQPFEQAIINEYLPGQGIAPHIDRDCFGPVVATVSLGSAVNMDFVRADGSQRHVERLEPRGLTLMSGDARIAWRHGIAKRRSDLWQGRRFQRQRRVSITFRTITDPAAPPSPS